MKKQVTVFGASGLVGNFLIQELLKEVSVTKINLVSRKPIPRAHEKVVSHVIDFSNASKNMALQGSAHTIWYSQNDWGR